MLGIGVRVRDGEGKGVTLGVDVALGVMLGVLVLVAVSAFVGDGVTLGGTGVPVNVGTVAERIAPLVASHVTGGGASGVFVGGSVLGSEVSIAEGCGIDVGNGGSEYVTYITYITTSTKAKKATTTKATIPCPLSFCANTEHFPPSC